MAVLTVLMFLLLRTNFMRAGWNLRINIKWHLCASACVLFWRRNLAARRSPGGASTGPVPAFGGFFGKLVPERGSANKLWSSGRFPGAQG